MWKYETPEIEIIYFEENVRTNVVGGSNSYIEPDTDNVETKYPF